MPQSQYVWRLRLPGAALDRVVVIDAATSSGLSCLGRPPAAAHAYRVTTHPAARVLWCTTTGRTGEASRSRPACPWRSAPRPPWRRCPARWSPSRTTGGLSSRLRGCLVEYLGPSSTRVDRRCVGCLSRIATVTGDNPRGHRPGAASLRAHLPRVHAGSDWHRRQRRRGAGQAPGVCQDSRTSRWPCRGASASPPATCRATSSPAPKRRAPMLCDGDHVQLQSATSSRRPSRTGVELALDPPTPSRSSFIAMGAASTSTTFRRCVACTPAVAVRRRRRRDPPARASRARRRPSSSSDIDR